MAPKEKRKMDTEIESAIEDFSRDTLIDLLDDATGVGCRDEDAEDSLRDEVKAEFVRGNISRETILDLA
jgi:hypothetical protein